MEDLLFTQELVELVNGSSCSLIGSQSSGCAYDLKQLENSNPKGGVNPKRLSISFRETPTGVKITSMTLRTEAAGSVRLNRNEHRYFRSSCKAVLDRCYLTGKVAYGRLKRVVILFGKGVISYEVKDGVLTVKNIPLIEGYGNMIRGMERGILLELSEVLSGIYGDAKNPVIVGWGISRVERRDYYECHTRYNGCKDFQRPIRKVTISVKANDIETSMRFFVRYPGTLIGYEEGILSKELKNQLKSE